MPGRSDVAITTGRPEFDDLPVLVRSFLACDRLDLVIDGQSVAGYRSPDARSIWIRDHSDMMRGFRYFEPDVTSAVQHFADTQSARGRIFDYFTTFPERPPAERENWTKYVRVPVEADVEFRFVKGAFLAWQASADDAWIAALVPAMEKALAYVQSHPWYWDAGSALPKRPYTIDTWDFAYTAGRHDWLQFQVTPDTYWGVMHGDASGYCEAFGLMGAIYERLGDADRAEGWRRRAAALRDAMNRLCWNGQFYTHFVKLAPVVIAGVDEAVQLSLSNPMDINRGVATHEQAVSILREYRRRRADGHAFAEWYSIDPPFPDGIFGDDRLVAGAYCNGGIMPLVGGELARAAFEHGFERYGVDILRRYHSLVAARADSYLWYFPDGRPSSIAASTSPEAQPTDGWGSSAMLWALVEGLAGVVDEGRGFDRVRLSPRWSAAGVEEAEVSAGYRACGRGLEYRFRLGGGRLSLHVAGDALELRFHVLLPDGARARSVTIDGTAVEFREATVEQSRYVDFGAPMNGGLQVVIAL